MFAFGGAESGDPCVWDVREIQQVRERFYPRMNISEADEAAEMAKDSKRKLRAKNFKTNQRFLKKKKGRKVERKAMRLEQNKKKEKLKRQQERQGGGGGKRKKENVLTN